jgi:hypothetical protein
MLTPAKGLMLLTKLFTSRSVLVRRHHLAFQSKQLQPPVVEAPLV